jgi:hypothetical protein
MALTTSVSRRQRVPDPPIGIVASITGGFEAVNARLLLAAMPLVLDVFLWLGPRLSIKPLLDELLRFLNEASAGALELSPNFGLLTQMINEIAERFNLFALLSTSPLGLPSLMAARGSAQTPLGSALIWPVDNPLLYLVLFGVFVLLGLLLGALYFGGIAQQVRDGQLDVTVLLRRVWGDWFRLVLLTVLALIVLFVLGGPIAIIAGIAGLSSPLVGQLLYVFGGTLILWVLIFGGFAIHGIVLQNRGLWGALRDSVRLVQTSLPQTAGLFASVMLIDLGLSAVWSIPENNSWWRLLGLAGHALVSSALVAATFVFYKDRYRWLLEVQQAMKAQSK